MRAARAAGYSYEVNRFVEQTSGEILGASEHQVDARLAVVNVLQSEVIIFGGGESRRKGAKKRALADRSRRMRCVKH